MQTRVENLTRSIEGLEHEVTRLSVEFRRRTYAIVGTVAIIAVVGMLFARAEVDSAKAIARNNARLCPVITVFADTGGVQSTTPRGRQIQQQFEQLARDFDCAHATTTP